MHVRSTILPRHPLEDVSDLALLARHSKSPSSVPTVRVDCSHPPFSRRYLDFPGVVVSLRLDDEVDRWVRV